jgi:hypothetical protein
MNDYNVVGVFCDDIREEKSGKHTLVGIYPDGVRLSLPTVIPKLAIYVRMHIRPDFDLRSISMTLRGPDGAETVIGHADPAQFKAQQAKIDPSNPAAYIGLIMQAIASPLAVNTAGKFALVAKINDVETVATTLRVSQKATPDPIASERPASQSQPASPASST